MTTTHTEGPWAVSPENPKIIKPADQFGMASNVIIGSAAGHPNSGFFPTDEEAVANARLIAAAPELLEALEEAVDLAWIEDSHQVEFDPTVMFSEFYDFSRLDGTSRIEFYGQHSCIVWPGSKWSAYCTYDGSLWFEKFNTAQEAKEACMRLLDKVLPDHPAMRARAAIRKARGAQ